MLGDTYPFLLPLFGFPYNSMSYIALVSMVLHSLLRVKRACLSMS